MANLAQNFQKIITMDGPGGVGKGTVSRMLAHALGWQWLDSGALYRLTAHAAQQSGVRADEVEQLVDIASHLKVEFSCDLDSENPPILLGGVNVNAYIRTETCGDFASKISAHPLVRSALFERQRAFATLPGLVTDGRDMGTVIFPESKLKIFLMADPTIRAQRRHRQLIKAGQNVNIDDLLRDIKARDARDRSRAIAPLKPAEDAVIVDTSTLSVSEVYGKIMPLVRSRFNLTAEEKEGLEAVLKVV